tara:strand:+ start:478 stop:1080 length:603 start_codon:yes stop_codon:yes gene_type:complete
LNFLSLDSASISPSVSVFIDNKYVDIITVDKKSSSILPSMTNEILTKNNLKTSDLDYIAITIGPGSFTGLRVGLSLAQGLAYSVEVPIASVNLLDVLISKIDTKNNGLVALYSHANFIFCKNIKNSGSTKLVNINDIKGQSVYGLHLERFKDIINYHEIICTSKDIGEYSIQNYDKIISSDVGSLKPIYLNEYKVDSKND